MKLRYRTVFLSDTHLGSRGSQARDLVRFLRCIECERLYLVGDIVDLWRMKNRTFWPSEHNDAVQQVLKIVKSGVDVLFIPGNHDEAARQYCGLRFGGVRVEHDAVHHAADGRTFLVTHGDQFDLVVKHSHLLSLLGSAAYEWLIRVNRVYNGARRMLGYDYWSLAQYVKLKVKSACMFVSRFEEMLANEARRRGMDGVICGHIHKAEARRHGNIAYYNCGDWTESCTAVVEHFDGSIEVIEALPAIAEMVKRQAALAHLPDAGADEPAAAASAVA
jgi:UDP-2,3-diacylglucosamine pyrophosphatase LpxH